MKKLLIAAAVIGLGACTNGNLVGTYDAGSVAGLSGASNSFNKNLQANYVALGTGEYNEYDWCDGDHFYHKAETVGMGSNVDFDSPASRRLTAQNAALADGYASRLSAAFANGARNSKPATAAKAQSSYDCWLQEVEENFQPEDIAACRNSLEAALAELEGKPAPAPVAVQAPNAYTVWFDFDSAALTDVSKTVIDAAAKAAKKQKTKLVVVVGHTDRSGSQWYNQTLSVLRAEAVKTHLAAQGVDADIISTRGAGEMETAVSTGDGVRNAANRRAVITLQ